MPLRPRFRREAGIARGLPFEEASYYWVAGTLDNGEIIV